MKSALSFVKKNINSSEQWDGVNYTKNKIQQGSWDESLGVGMPHVPNQDLSRFQMQANKLYSKQNKWIAKAAKKSHWTKMSNDSPILVIISIGTGLTNFHLKSKVKKLQITNTIEILYTVLTDQLKSKQN